MISLNYPQIPGFKTVNDQLKDKDKIINVDEQAYNEYERLRQKDMLLETTSKAKTHRFYNRFKEFEKMPQNNFDVPIIRNASPYTSDLEQTRKEFQDSKKNWIADRNFHTYFGKSTTSRMDKHFISNYVFRDPSPPPIMHKFRVETKEKFLAGPFILKF